MKLIDILNESEQVKSYDEEYGKIMLDVDRDYDYVAYQYKGKNHRDDGKPAIVFTNGTQKWYKDGAKHRIGAPAIIYKQEFHPLEWWVNGQRHREDGPAVESRDGSKHWYYLKGREYTKEEWKKKVGKK